MSDRRFGRVTVSTSNEDKVFFPAEGITKGDLVDYYVAVAPRMMPHLRDRPLSFQRFPNGIEEKGFFQKDKPKHYPDWISTIPVRKKGGENNQVVVDRPAALAYLANNGVVTIHGALSSGPALMKPDRLIFDLDPSVDDFELVRDGAGAVREVLEDLSLPTFVQTTGSRGLHVVVPLRPEADFKQVGAFARKVAELVVESDPDAFTIEHAKADRGDRLLIDYFRNSYAQTAVVPYSVRAKPGAPVAMPLAWEEVPLLTHGAQTYTIASALERMRDGGDPWEKLGRRARSLKRAAERLLR